MKANYIVRKYLYHFAQKVVLLGVKMSPPAPAFLWRGSFGAGPSLRLGSLP